MGMEPLAKLETTQPCKLEKATQYDHHRKQVQVSIQWKKKKMHIQGQGMKKKKRKRKRERERRISYIITPSNPYTAGSEPIATLLGEKIPEMRYPPIPEMK